ncbi:phage replisome organizer N-terminal domain-containing protein [Streptococcus pneumoniae]|uniref:phage replisome organizer N-terminal domain-containing protein n=1 Tax=Streptococcus pneumoniae TaxID=1313 RepID=UPI000765533B|nr:phage replisome organizer N-terminal domain-containing protein [Streptococcus pneumoniae]UKP57437.1 replisome organizer [Streptococcus pneumoniae]CAG5521674.1 putative phage-associated protein [Streptococcus pneumoniae]CVW83196.1 putative phage-associated protein [Streptococcus pneumoniae]CWE03333.1 putative phage-associated protein [Streptococcus pneumoniae]
MAENRRYYWLKLKEDFFTDKRIKRLRRISGGDTYTIIYLKLLLLSLKNSGKLYYDGVETDFIKELALTIDETEDDVMVTVNYLVAQNLMEIIVENDEYFLTEIPNLIGSETASTRRSRKSRAYRENQKVLQCNTNATLGNLLQQNCNTEIEKEIDIELEKEGERKKQSLPPTLYGEYKNIRLTDEEYQRLTDKLQGHTDTMIEKLSRYIKSSGKIYQDHYVTILNWYEQDKERLSQINNKSGSSKTYSTNYEDSDSL